MASQTISGHFSCDNCYAVYVGNQNGVITKLLPTGSANGVYNTAASQIFNGEDLNPFTANTGDWLYIIAWSDDSAYQGLIGEFTGTQKIFTGDSAWQVYPTDKNYGNSQAPDQNEINSFIALANNTNGWVLPTSGPTNANSDAIFQSGNPNLKVDNVDNNANWVWYDSGNDGSSGSPFSGFNHNEFLIFRIPVWIMAPELEPVNCGCHGCNEHAEEQNIELIDRAKAKYNTLKSRTTCAAPFGEKCDNTALNPQVSLEPCFYLHWGDGSNDQIEEHDTEVFYLTVCNPFNDIQYNGLRITKITLIPNVHPIDKIHIVPDRFISLDCLEPCSCQTREFAMITRANDTAGTYKMEVEYCFSNITLTSSSGSGKAEFDLEITED